MRNKLFHAIVKENGEFLTRYAVRIEDNYVIFKKAAGIDMPAALFPRAINALGKDFLMECESLHQERPYPWRIGYWLGKSGNYSFWVESLVDPEYMIVKRSRRVYVSTRGKLNDLFFLPLRDIPPLLNSGEFPLYEGDSDIDVIIEDMEDFPLNMFNNGAE